MITIYGLVDPNTHDIRYIGKSIRPHERLHDHCNDHSDCHRTHWIQSLIRQGQRPELVILEELPDGADWQATERAWIAKGKAAGWPLTNNTSGGDGVPDLPPESRARIVSAWVGRKHRPETLVKIGAASRTRRHDEAWRDTMSQKMRGREITPQHRDRLKRAVAKLTDEEVREVRRLLAERVSQYVIAKRFGVHQGTISNIKRGLCYQDVE
ncbi:MAG TPA: helix-turn-helix domain-containing protein [Herpetosiphonaceae bacterium]|nr:helix-turn-helix domain-containing protein [Herpetosiphonaceae bacterium]